MDGTGRVALVTGVGRREGIGFAVCRRLAAAGYGLALHALEPEGRAAARRAAEERETFLEELRATGVRVSHHEADFADPAAPRHVVQHALRAHGRLDALVANHAHSESEPLGALSPESIDRHLAVNVRATLLLVAAFARAREGPGGRVVLLVSGSHRGPMPGELAYAASKGALVTATPSLADALAEQGVTVNAVNPGPTDTGWMDDATRAAVLARMPRGRLGAPDDAARLVAWLVSDDADWVTGQVIDSEGGFRRG